MDNIRFLERTVIALFQEVVSVVVVILLSGLYLLRGDVFLHGEENSYHGSRLGSGVQSR